MRIDDNYLFLQKMSEFNHHLIEYFYNRLGIFLCLDINKCPSVLFTKDSKKISALYNSYGETDFGRAFYDEVTNKIAFDVNEYNRIKFQEKNDKIQLQAKDNYIIPLSDIYHELIHSIQYFRGNYDSTPILEASDEMLTYYITGQYNLDYLKEALALWFVMKHVLKIKKNKHYVFVRDLIVKPEYNKLGFLSSSKFLNILSKKYNGNWRTFLNRFSNDFYNIELKQEFHSDIDYTHNLIFYKY